MNKVKWKFKLNTRNIMILFIGIVLNLLGKALTNYVTTPFWLDSIGTIFSAALLGPLGGVFVGGLSNIVFVYFDIINLFYLIINIIIGITVGYLYPRDLSDTFQMVYTATMLSLITIVTCTPINVLIYQGYTGNVWGNALCDKLKNDGFNFIFCAILGEAFVDFPDKVLSVAVATGFIFIGRKTDMLEDIEMEEAK